MRVLKEGTLLANRYTLLRRLGRGGMAEVWLASDRQAELPVALKILAPELLGRQEHRDRFRQEFRFSASLMHAHIVRVFEYHDDPDGPFYSLQYLNGGDLGLLCGKEPDIALRPAGLIADALRYAHAKGVVHRDIRTGNVLLDGNGAPYLVDFGVAALPDSATGGGAPVGASPQQREGRPAAAADDIYAFGVMLHELLTGEPPAREGASRPVPRAAHGGPLPGALVQLIDDMLADDPALRPAAAEVAQRLRDAGFPPGPVPRRLLAAPAPVAAAAVDPVQPIRPVRPRAAAAGEPAAAADTAAGVSPKLLFGGLAVAIVLFIGVIYGLPALVGTPSGEPAAPAPTAPAGERPAVAEAAGTPALERTPGGSADDTAAFSENLRIDSGSDGARVKAATDEALGDLLSRLERLRYRAIDRWGGQAYLDAVDVYAAGDAAYVSRNYALAGERYRKATAMLEPFFQRIDAVFAETMASAREAFAKPDPSEAVRLFDLAVAITPGHREAEAWLARARNLEAVIGLTEQGRQFEKDLELEPALLAFEKALELDPQWEAAAAGIERVRVALKQLNFDTRMTEGLTALADGDFASARAAFEAARLLDPNAAQPADGLLQVDQGIRLANIRRLEDEAEALVADEQWEAAIGIYEEILGIDPDLAFAKEGLASARSRAALHGKLQALIESPDTLSDPANMQEATRLLLDVARVSPMGPRLADQKSELSRLLKRAATPLRVQLVSDNATEVSIYKIGRFGTFASRELELRPGVYVAVGIRPGFRDVRLEFRVAPEIEMKPIVIRCEEPI